MRLVVLGGLSIPTMGGMGQEDRACFSYPSSVNEDGLGRLSIRAALLDHHGLGNLAPWGRGVRFLRLGWDVPHPTFRCDELKGRGDLGIVGFGG